MSVFMSAAAAPASTDFYARNTYTVAGSYKAPQAAAAYDNSGGYGQTAPSYNSQQVGHLRQRFLMRFFIQ